MKQVGMIKKSFKFAKKYMDPGHIPFISLINAIPRETGPAGDWAIWVLVVSLSLVSVVRFFFPGHIRQISTAVWSIRHFHILHKEGVVLYTPGYLFKVNFLLVLSLLIYQSLEHTGLIPEGNIIGSFRIFLLVLFLLMVFYPVKSMIMGILAWVFQTGRASSAYFSNIFVFNQFAGLVLMPLVFIHAYNPFDYLLYSAWAVLALLNLYKVFRGSLLSFDAAGFSVYYLFLYLCGVELAPLLLIIKAASAYLFNH